MPQQLLELRAIVSRFQGRQVVEGILFPAPARQNRCGTPTTENGSERPCSLWGGFFVLSWFCFYFVVGITVGARLLLSRGQMFAPAVSGKCSGAASHDFGGLGQREQQPQLLCCRVLSATAAGRQFFLGEEGCPQQRLVGRSSFLAREVPLLAVSTANRFRQRDAENKISKRGSQERFGCSGRKPSGTTTPDNSYVSSAPAQTSFMIFQRCCATEDPISLRRIRSPAVRWMPKKVCWTRTV